MTPSHSHTPHIHTAHCHSKAERLAEADALVREQGARFTTMRRATFEFLLAQKAPLSAYDILANLETRLKKKLAPPTVYRALEFLLEQGLIHRLESNNTYLACDHPGERHESVYLVCTGCGATQEVDDPSVGKLLQSRAAAYGFSPSRQVIEIQGLCRQCLE
ncbi:MAG: transcriptional repressor [Pseudomonadota bacterium]